MNPVKIIDLNFNLLGEIDDYESLQWTRRWNSPGEFEMHISLYKNGVDTLKKNNIILSGNKAGIIKHIEIKVDEKGKGGEELLIKGFSLSSIIGTRITLAPSGQAYDIISGDVETVMKHYIDANCINPVDSKRKIQQLILAPNKNRGPSIKYQSRLKPLDEELKNLSIISGIGWDVFIDISNKQWIFDVSEGRDLTTKQTENNPVIFSTDFDNIQSQHYVDSDVGYRNQGYIGGQGEGTDRTIVEVGDGLSGIDRIETFIDARDLNDTNDLAARGQQKLDELCKTVTLESSILTYGPFKYEEDWDLGDIVTIINPKWGLMLDSRITEINEIYEPSGFKLQATFGNSIPTLIDKIKQTFNQFHQEIVR